ncbi:hypothetical protein HNR14_002485 [Leifsonia naganoensis]|uniref:Uncharacterized protein n=1 Tax=Leifsonia naganoensis TaxID=150025 RepID=A0A853DUR1_9MICO|nr:hypothetical protein [Leifsonia naganoensis]
MLLQAIEDQTSGAGVSLERMTITRKPDAAVLATPTLAMAFGALQGGWFVGEMVKNVIRGG